METAEIDQNDTAGKTVSMLQKLGNEIQRSPVVRTARENPLPMALIGAGAGLLAYKMYFGGRSTEGKPSKAAAILDLTRNSLSGFTGTVSSAATCAYERAAGAMGHALTGAGDLASQAYTKAGDLESTAVEQCDHFFEEQPLVVGAVALALGAAVGLAVPSTRYERELMGPKREEFLNKAQKSATDLVEEAKDILAEAAETVAQRASMADH